MLMSYLRNKTIASPVAILLMAMFALGLYMNYSIFEQEVNAAEGGIEGEIAVDENGNVTKKIKAKVTWSDIGNIISWVGGLFSSDSGNNESNTDSNCSCGCGSSNSSCGC